MKLSIKKGFSFGLTSGIITTLGMIIGLHSSTHSTAVVIGGVFVIAIADALSDALGIHISEEFENSHTAKEVWESTSVTFLSKFIFALTFVAPFLLLSLSAAIIANVIWGMSPDNDIQFLYGETGQYKAQSSSGRTFNYSDFGYYRDALYRRLDCVFQLNAVKSLIC